MDGLNPLYDEFEKITGQKLTRPTVTQPTPQTTQKPQTTGNTGYQTQTEALKKAATILGVDPLDLATVIDYETIGTYSPTIQGGKGNNYRGLIQFGREEYDKYKVGQNTTFESQVLNSVVPYFQDRFKAVGRETKGATLLDLYKTVNGGNPNVSENASDSTRVENGKVVRNTIGWHVQRMSKANRERAMKRFGFTAAQIDQIESGNFDGLAKEFEQITGRSLTDQASATNSDLSPLANEFQQITGQTLPTQQNAPQLELRTGDMPGVNQTDNSALIAQKQQQLLNEKDEKKREAIALEIGQLQNGQTNAPNIAPQNNQNNGDDIVIAPLGAQNNQQQSPYVKRDVRTLPKGTKVNQFEIDGKLPTGEEYLGMVGGKFRFRDKNGAEFEFDATTRKSTFVEKGGTQPTTTNPNQAMPLNDNPFENAGQIQTLGGQTVPSQQTSTDLPPTITFESGETITRNDKGEYADAKGTVYKVEKTADGKISARSTAPQKRTFTDKQKLVWEESDNAENVPNGYTRFTNKDTNRSMVLKIAPNGNIEDSKEEFPLWVTDKTTGASAFNDAELEKKYRQFLSEHPNITDSETLRRKFIDGNAAVKAGTQKTIFTTDEANAAANYNNSLIAPQQTIVSRQTQTKPTAQTRQTIGTGSQTQSPQTNGQNQQTEQQTENQSGGQNYRMVFPKGKPEMTGARRWLIESVALGIANTYDLPMQAVIDAIEADGGLRGLGGNRNLKDSEYLDIYNIENSYFEATPAEMEQYRQQAEAAYNKRRKTILDRIGRGDTISEEEWAALDPSGEYRRRLSTKNSQEDELSQVGMAEVKGGEKRKEFDNYVKQLQKSDDEFTRTNAANLAKMTFGWLSPQEGQRRIDLEKGYRENAYSQEKDVEVSTVTGYTQKGEPIYKYRKRTEAEIQQSVEERMKRELAPYDGNISAFVDEQERLRQKYGGRQFAGIADAGKTFARYIATIPSTILDAAAVVKEYSVPALVSDYFFGTDSSASKSILRDAAQGWRNQIENDIVLKRNPDLRNDFITNDVAQSLAQITTQMILAPLTGGASFLLPLAEASTSQYFEADKAGAGKWTRLGATLIGGAAALPDVFLQMRYLKMLSPALKFKFLGNFGKSLFGRFSAQVGEKEAAELTRRTLSAFVYQGVKSGVFEAGQEASEDLINKAYEYATYNDKVNFVPNEQEIKGYGAAGIGGLLGVSVAAAGQLNANSDTEQINTGDKYESSLGVFQLGDVEYYYQKEHKAEIDNVLERIGDTRKKRERAENSIKQLNKREESAKTDEQKQKIAAQKEKFEEQIQLLNDREETLLQTVSPYIKRVMPEAKPKTDTADVVATETKRQTTDGQEYEVLPVRKRLFGFSKDDNYTPRKGFERIDKPDTYETFETNNPQYVEVTQQIRELHKEQEQFVKDVGIPLTDAEIEAKKAEDKQNDLDLSDDYYKAVFNLPADQQQKYDEIGDRISALYRKQEEIEREIFAPKTETSQTEITDELQNGQVVFWNGAEVTVKNANKVNFEGEDFIAVETAEGKTESVPLSEIQTTRPNKTETSNQEEYIPMTPIRDDEEIENEPTKVIPRDGSQTTEIKVQPLAKQKTDGETVDEFFVDENNQTRSKDELPIKKDEIQKPSASLESSALVSKQDVQGENVSAVDNTSFKPLRESVNNLGDSVKGKKQLNRALNNIDDVLKQNNGQIADDKAAVKVLNEINRINMNLNSMGTEADTVRQNLKPITDSLRAQGYEITDLLGKEYDSGMNIEATKQSAEGLEIGEERIIWVGKPQIMKNGKTIQRGKITVGFNLDTPADYEKPKSARQIEAEKSIGKTDKETSADTQVKTDRKSKRDAKVKNTSQRDLAKGLTFRAKKETSEQKSDSALIKNEKSLEQKADSAKEKSGGKVEQNNIDNRLRQMREQAQKDVEKDFTENEKSQISNGAKQAVKASTRKQLTDAKAQLATKIAEMESRPLGKQNTNAWAALKRKIRIIDEIFAQYEINKQKADNRRSERESAKDNVRQIAERAISALNNFVENAPNFDATARKALEKEIADILSYNPTYFETSSEKNTASIALRNLPSDVRKGLKTKTSNQKTDSALIKNEKSLEQKADSAKTAKNTPVKSRIYTRLQAEDARKQNTLPRFFVQEGNGDFDIKDSTRKPAYENVEIPQGMYSVTEALRYVDKLNGGEETAKYYTDEPVKKKEKIGEDNTTDQDLTSKYKGVEFKHHGEKRRVHSLIWYAGKHNVIAEEYNLATKKWQMISGQAYPFSEIETQLKKNAQTAKSSPLKMVSTIEDWNSADYIKRRDAIPLEKNAAGKLLSPNGAVSNLQNETLWRTVRTREFKQWSNNWKEVVKDGNQEPKILFHGTTHDFDVFDASRGNIENHFGKAIYLTDSQSDVAENYAGFGADLTSRIEREAERIQAEDEDLSFDEAKELAKANIAGNSPQTMPLFAKMSNPLILKKNGGNRFDALEQYDEETDEYTENEDSLPMKLYNALQDVAPQYNADAQEIWDGITEGIGYDWDGTTFYDVEKAMRGVDTLTYATDDEYGDLAGNEVIKEVFREMGFDGIVIDANEAFGSKRKYGKAMVMDEDTKHYHVFDSTDVKSLYNIGTFSKDEPSILKMVADNKRDSEYSLTAEDLLKLPETIDRIENTTDDPIEVYAKQFLAKTSNYKDGIFYHATGGFGESGVGKGLYVGKDKKVLHNFYNMDGGKVETYYGTPNFLDLADYDKFDAFEKEAEKKFGKLAGNEQIKKLVLEKGFDGIRYYDPQATGEEFVIFREGVLSKNKPKEQIEIIQGDSITELPKLVKQGAKFNSIILDPPYFSKALVGGSRGIKDYDFISAEDFGKVMNSVAKLTATDDSHVYLMLSGARTAQADMRKYVEAARKAGFKIVKTGKYQKTFQDGKAVTNVRGETAEAEQLYLLTKSGKARKGETEIEMNFSAVRPTVGKSYSTQKANSFINGLIRQSTKRGESVLDPFAGSGVSGVEAVKENRTVTLIDKSEKAVSDFIKPNLSQGSLFATLKMVAGEKGIRNLAESDQKTIANGIDAEQRLANLAIAKEMEAAGKDAKTIWLASGWERNAKGDGKWKTEIDDAKFFTTNSAVKSDELTTRYKKQMSKEGFDSESWEDYGKFIEKHPELNDELDNLAELARNDLREKGKTIEGFTKWIQKFRQTSPHGQAPSLAEIFPNAPFLKAYPELKTMHVLVTRQPSTSRGWFNGHGIILTANATNPISTIHHETQHAIQEIEGFARGGNVEVFGQARNNINRLFKDMDAMFDKLGYENWLINEMTDSDAKKISNRKGNFAGMYVFAENQKNKATREAMIAKLDQASDVIEENSAIFGKYGRYSDTNDTNLYKALGGETEARNVQTRLNMSPTERAQKTLAETEDVARESQIYILDSIGKAESALKKLTDNTESESEYLDDIIPLATSRIDSDALGKNIVVVNKAGAELLSIAEGLLTDKKPVTFAGQMMSKATGIEAQDYIDVLAGIADEAENNGLDAAAIDDLINNLDEATPDDGIVRVEVEGREDARLHEAGHQTNERAAAASKQLTTRVGDSEGNGNVNNFLDTELAKGGTISDITDRAFNKFFSDYGYGNQTLTEKAVIVEETWNYIQTNDYHKLGLTAKQAATFAYHYFKNYVAKHGKEAIATFEKYYEAYKINAEHLEQVKNEIRENEIRETEQRSKAEIRTNQIGDAPAGRESDRGTDEDVSAESAKTGTAETEVTKADLADAWEKAKQKEREAVADADGDVSAGLQNQSRSGQKQSATATETDTISEITGETPKQIGVKNRQFAKSLSNAFYGIGDVEYEAQSEQKWLKQSQKDIDDLGTDGAIDKYNSLDPKSSEGYKTALGVAIASELYANGTREQFQDFGKKLTTDIGNIAQELRATQLLSRLSPEHALLIAQKKKGKNLTEEESIAVERMAQELKTVSDDLDSATAIIADTERRAQEFEDLANEIKKVLTEETAKTGELKKDLSKAKQQATRYKNLYNEQKPTKTYSRKQLVQYKKDVLGKKSDYEELLRRAFSTGSLKMTAWHGSPHVFDKFSLDKLLTGEGANVYGAGLYFTDSEAVAQHYRRAGIHYYSKLKMGGINVTKLLPGDLARQANISIKSAEAIQYLAQEGVDRVLTEQDIQKLTKKNPELKVFDFTVENNETTGAKYEVDLKPEADEYLLWDKPLSEQSAKVKKALEQTVEKDSSIQTAIDEDFSGRWVYDTLAKGKNNKEGARKASEYLKSLGVRGIKYLDGTSRNKGEGSYNYVIFDDADVEIKQVLRMVAPPKEMSAEVFDALTDLAAIKLLDGIPQGLTNEAFDEYLGDISNGQLTQAEKNQIHAAAWEKITPEPKEMSQEQKDILKVRAEHGRRAAEILNMTENVQKQVIAQEKELLKQKRRELADTEKAAERAEREAEKEEAKRLREQERELQKQIREQEREIARLQAEAERETANTALENKEAFRYDKFARAVINAAKSVNSTSEAVFVAFALRELSNVRAVKQIAQEVYPSMTDAEFNKYFVEGRKLLETTKEILLKERVLAKTGAKDSEYNQLLLEQKDLKKRQLIARRHLDELYRQLTLDRTGKILETIQKIYNIPRSFGFSGDAGFMFRQGGKAAVMNSGAWKDAMKVVYPAFRNKKMLDDMIFDFYESDIRKRAEARGMKFKSIGDQTFAYEDWANSFFEDGFDTSKGKAKGVKKAVNAVTFIPRRSNMAHGAFLDVLRLKIFEDAYAKLKDMHERGKITDEELLASETFFASKFAPVITGQGHGQLTKDVNLDNVLNLLASIPFAAPRLRLSHFQFLYYMNPARAAFLPKGARKLVYQKQLRFYAPVLSFLAIGIMAGLIGDDDEDSAFLKIKGDKLAEWTGFGGFKDMYVDMSGGAKEAWRTASLGARKLLYETGIYNDQKELDSINKELKQMYISRPKYKDNKYAGQGIGTFWRYGLHPTLNIGSSLIDEQDPVGNPYGATQAVRDVIFPLPVRQVSESATYKGDTAAKDRAVRLIVTLATELTGISAQSYKRRVKEEKPKKKPTPKK